MGHAAVPDVLHFVGDHERINAERFDGMMSTRTASLAIGCSPRTLRRFVHEGRIHAVRYLRGGNFRFVPQEVERFVRDEYDSYCRGQGYIRSTTSVGRPGRNRWRFETPLEVESRINQLACIDDLHKALEGPPNVLARQPYVEPDTAVPDEEEI